MRRAAEKKYERFNLANYTPSSGVNVTNKILIGPKQAKANGLSSELSEPANWYVKDAGQYQEKVALIEVSSREFARLVNRRQMKTRLARDEEKHLWIASKELPSYKNLKQYLIEKHPSSLSCQQLLGAYMEAVWFEFEISMPEIEEKEMEALRKKEALTLREEAKRRCRERLLEEDRRGLKVEINWRRCRGLGHTVLMAAFLNEADVKLDNLGRDQNGYLIMHDFGWSLPYLRSQEKKITEAVIANLPEPPESVHNWLSMVANGKSYHMTPSFCELAKLKSQPGFRREINESMLNILVLPDALIVEFFKYYTDKLDEAFGEVIYNKILQKKQELREAALANPSFQAYLMSDAAVLQFHQHQEYVNEFCLTGKDRLTLPDLMMEMRHEFEGLQVSMTYQQASLSSTAKILVSTLSASSQSSRSSLSSRSSANDSDEPAESQRQETLAASEMPRRDEVGECHEEKRLCLVCEPALKN